ncbi:hypothetical protein [Roseomonas harenae]|uniref:hypothetical protein n=1 Tax=Muricoccus harenae TaxID=2692566 RepID=UPI00133169D0|nr:hypothetical protein [Roseomonas harenae]
MDAEIDEGNPEQAEDALHRFRKLEAHHHRIGEGALQRHHHAVGREAGVEDRGPAAPALLCAPEFVDAFRVDALAPCHGTDGAACRRRDLGTHEAVEPADVLGLRRAEYSLARAEHVAGENDPLQAATSATGPR